MIEREDFKKLVKGMKAVYAQPTFLPDQDAFNVWYSLLRDLEYNVCSAAIQAYMLRNKFPPTIADIRELAQEIKHGEAPTWEEGWNKVLLAIRKVGMYREAEALETLDPITRQVTERLGFQNLCKSTNETADRANFRDVYKQIVERQKKEEQLPPALKLTMQDIREGIAVRQQTALTDKEQ